MTTFGNQTFLGESHPGADGVSILQFSHVPQQLLTTFSIMLRLLSEFSPNDIIDKGRCRIVAGALICLKPTP
ncbi:hypothetical protein [Breoghania sp.]|uniref:hypothetical protein n=1 Tax=Breoghania sp. TaxID=2065378 RepID=UPI002AA602A0|nr:hypothetical protein [Breoghania sp.]